MKLLKNNAYSLTVLAISILVSCYFYQELPGEVATKFDFNGNPTQYSSREFLVAFIPILYLFLILLMSVLINASPAKFAIPNSRRSMDVIMVGVGLLMLSIHLGLIKGSGNAEIFLRYFSLGFALFLLVVGNVIGKTERNFFIGYRVPWTLASDQNWRATHRFSGKLMVASGLVLFVLSLVFFNIWLLTIVIAVTTLTPVVYSYLFYRKKEA